MRVAVQVMGGLTASYGLGELVKPARFARQLGLAKSARIPGND